MSGGGDFDSGCGQAGLIKGEWIKEGAIVVDVGINKVEDRLSETWNLPRRKNALLGSLPFPASRPADCSHADAQPRGMRGGLILQL